MYLNFIRVFHAVPNIGLIDIYLNDKPVITGQEYKDFSQFLTVPTGNFNLKVYPSKQRNKPLCNKIITVLPRSAMTIAINGTLPTINLLAISEPHLLTPSANKFYVKFVHLSPNAPALDITLVDGSRIFNDVEYTGITKYISGEPGIYTFQVRPSGGNQVLSSIPFFKLKHGKIYTIYAVGFVGDSPILKAIIYEFENF